MKNLKSICLDFVGKIFQGIHNRICTNLIGKLEKISAILQYNRIGTNLIGKIGKISATLWCDRIGTLLILAVKVQ